MAGCRVQGWGDHHAAGGWLVVTLHQSTSCHDKAQRLHMRLPVDLNSPLHSRILLHMPYHYGLSMSSLLLPLMLAWASKGKEGPAFVALYTLLLSGEQRFLRL
jgi:hypothetical protein